jgi:hypothetical protein
MLLSRVITGQHQGRVDLEWREQGLVCTMRLPRRPDATPPGSP